VLIGPHRVGHGVAVDGRIPKIVDNLAVVKPTMMAAAPRIFEKVYNKIVEGAKVGRHEAEDLRVGRRVGKQVLAAPPGRARARRACSRSSSSSPTSWCSRRSSALRRPRAVLHLRLGAAVARDRGVLPRLRAS
jgi:hypothetical protein